jgi:hypothetical protein
MDTICNEVDSEYTVTIRNKVKSEKLPCISIRQVCEVHALTHIAPYYLISDIYDGKFKYYRTPPSIWSRNTKVPPKKSA